MGPRELMTDRQCPGLQLAPGIKLTECVATRRCAQLLNLAPANAPVAVTLPCGWEQETSSLMLCCPEQLVTDAAPAPPPRFPVPGGQQGRPCEDRSHMCPTWAKNGACLLNQTFIVSDWDQNGVVDSDLMFEVINSFALV